MRNSDFFALEPSEIEELINFAYFFVWVERPR